MITVHELGISFTQRQKLRLISIKKGATGDVVRELQANIVKLGYALTVNGKFDDRTIMAVRAFQATEGLKDTGNVDKETWDRIESMSRKVVIQIPSPDKKPIVSMPLPEEQTSMLNYALIGIVGVGVLYFLTQR